MIGEYLKLLRRSDEISHRALLRGMTAYGPDADKAAHYERQKH